MRAIQEGRPSLEKVEAAAERLPAVNTEAGPSECSLAKSSSTDLILSESLPEIQAWENKGPGSVVAWMSETQELASRAAKAQAWETQANEAQRRSTQSRPTSVMELDRVLKQKPLIKKVEVPKKKQSKPPFVRPLWSNKAKYILTLVGYSVRTINFWRFPFLWLRNGGWSFFIIYLLLLFFIGIPLLFLEMAVGHRVRQGGIGLWKIISPWVGGVGCASFMVCIITGSCMNVISAWIFIYLSQSFTHSVPWEHCPLLPNSSHFDPECERTTPSMYFWYRKTLQISDRIEDGGPPVFSLSISLLLSWCLLGALMINGFRSMEKVVYVLVPAPYLIMLCLLIRGLLLEGAFYGLQHLKMWKVSAMYDLRVWFHAGVQVLFTLGLGYGSIISLSSYLRPSNNCLNDAFVVAMVNLGSMVFVTPVIFCTLGFWATGTMHRCSEKNAETLSRLVVQGKLPPEAHPPDNLHANPAVLFSSWLSNLPQAISSLVLRHIAECNLEKQFLKMKEAPRFAFLAFIETMSFAPGSVFWTTLYFLMLLTFGLNVMMGIMQGIITPLQDTFSSFRRYPKLFTVVVLVLMFLCSLFFIRPSGYYYIGLISERWLILPVLIIIILENMAVAWAYGARRFLADMVTPKGTSTHLIFRWLWCCVSPVVLLVLFTASLVLLSTKTMTYAAWDSSTSKEVLLQYPPWVLSLMIGLYLIVLLPIPVYFVYCLTHGIPFKAASLVRLSEEVPKEETLQDDHQTADHRVA